MNIKWYVVITGLVLILLYFGIKPVFKNTYETAIKSDLPIELSPSTTQKLINSNSTMSNGQPPMVIDQNKNYAVVLKTDVGNIKIALNAKGTPITANNFYYLAQNNFYNGTIFHRAIKGFMIQGGDPKGDGTGDPGYKFNDEPFTGEYARGAVAMANSGPNSNGSQFFIMHADYPLPKNYVIFGRVIEGMETVDVIAAAPVEKNMFGELSKPVNPIKINSVETLEL